MADRLAHHTPIFDCSIYGWPVVGKFCYIALPSRARPCRSQVRDFTTLGHISRFHMQAQKMLKWILLVVLILHSSLELAHFASFLPKRQANWISLLEYQRPVHDAPSTNETPNYIDPTTTAAQYNSDSSDSTAQPGSSNTQPSTWDSTSVTDSSDSTTVVTSPLPQPTVPPDPNADPEDPLAPSRPTNGPPGQVTLLPTGNRDPDEKVANNKSKPQIIGDGNSISSASTELSVLFYSIFIVYVSFIKLIYYNVSLINRNLTEPGILMIFGIIWELVVRQITDNYESSPRFNSRIFFYLFLPSTVLESASLLSNKWLFLNLLPILVHSILGTLFYASCLGFSIYALNNQNVFSMAAQRGRSSAVFTGWQQYSYLIEPNEGANKTPSAQDWPPEIVASSLSAANISENYTYDKGYLTSSSSPSSTGGSTELANLTLADCLVFGTILSSIDSTIVLEVFRQVQVNKRLYYLVIGENLMNNAVVIVIFDLLLDFFNETRITVVKIYIAITKFFVTLFGSIFIGLLLAGVALISIRLSKRLQLQRPSYSYQCQAMVETLLILKLAYLTYTLASLAGTSSIVSLATFGILQDQYIKHSLNLRSQLTFKQFILATKTIGYSLVYPLLGMFLVEVANTSHFFQAWLSYNPESVHPSHGHGMSDGQAGNYTGLGGPASMFTAASVAASKLSHLASQANLDWNFKFLSLVTLMTVAIRFAVVFALSVFCNLFSSSQLRFKFREQVLLAYGGLKGPLAFALVNRLIEHEEYRDRTLRNKHLFMYTILFITFVSTLIKGSFIRPLVSKMQPTLGGSLPASSDGVATGTTTAANTTIVFDEINSKVTEYVTHGLNSILGHTKSPYDRFADLNETHIKPWLARGDSNTNWLSLFYDGLILDETLNANCFYRTIEVDPTTSHYSRKAKSTIGDGVANNSDITVSKRVAAVDAGLSRSHRGARRPSSSGNPILATIDENNRTSIQVHPSSGIPFSSMRPHKRSSNVPNSSRHAIGESSSQQQPESSVLKELVMYNLKVENARKRRRDPRPAATQARNKVEPMTTSCDDDFLAIERQRIARMLSTTDSSDDPTVGAQMGASGSAQTTMDKNRHLAQVERKLVAAAPEQTNPSRLAPQELLQLTRSNSDRPTKKVGPLTATLAQSKIHQHNTNMIPASSGIAAPNRIEAGSTSKMAGAKQAASRMRRTPGNNHRTHRKQKPP